MSVKIFDSTSQAYAEPQSVPKRYDAESSAYVETTGNAYDPDAAAWEEKWSPCVSAYVYGAVSETVTIKKDGIIVATVATNADGVSDDQIKLAYGTYTLTGSVSGWTEEQTVDEDTTKFRAMPAGALYWYGNNMGLEECTSDNGWTIFANYPQKSPVYNTNYISLVSTRSPKNTSCCLGTRNAIDSTKYTTVKSIVKGITNFVTIGYGYVFPADTKRLSQGGINIDNSALNTYTQTISNERYVALETLGSQVMNVYALWIE